ncbi:MAG: hypothetical protein ACR2N2_08510, partial [Acidimicrobiia bacterium]
MTYRSRIARLAVVGTIVVSTLAIAPPAHAALPDISFSLSTDNAGEGDGTHEVVVRLNTDGSPLAAPLTFEIADLLTGTATAGDYSFGSPTALQFDIDDNDGETRSLTVNLVSDTTDE